ncbi:hypothetical protein BG000_001541 [Podila horticola]|nr:hypothetical protein BG000_001541 [Podila horticola]
MDNAKYHHREYQANPTNNAVSETEVIDTIDDYMRLKISRLKDRKAGKVGGKYKPLTAQTIAVQLRTCKKATLYDLARLPENTLPLSTEVIAKRFGFDVLWLLPYHPDINPIEEGWGIAKGHVAPENNGSQPFGQVKNLLLEGFKKVDWRHLVRRVQKKEQECMRGHYITEEESDFVIDIDEDTEEEEDTDTADEDA